MKINENIQKMLDGKIYDPSDPELAKRQVIAHSLCTKINATPLEEIDKKISLLNKLFPNHKENFYVEGGIYVDYGCNTYFGNNFYANYGLTILDTCKVEIGDNCFFGPHACLYTPKHPLRYQDRNSFIDQKTGRFTDKEYASPIKIGDNCWFGGNVTVLPGVTIGNGCVIGAGSVVTRDIPDNSLAFGNPCKVVRKITEQDSLDNHPELF